MDCGAAWSHLWLMHKNLLSGPSICQQHWYSRPSWQRYHTTSSPKIYRAYSHSTSYKIFRLCNQLIKQASCIGISNLKMFFMTNKPSKSMLRIGVWLIITFQCDSIMSELLLDIIKVPNSFLIINFMDIRLTFGL